jgi:MscS family membrane protein
MALGELFSFIDYLSNDFVRAAVIFVVLLIVLRVVLYILQKVAFKVASKTKTELDDMLFKKSSSPLTIIALLISLRVALLEISLSETLALSISRTIYSAIVIMLGYLVYITIDLVLIEAWRKISVRSKTKLDESLTNLVHQVLKASLIVLALLYILDLWGIEIIPILGALGVAGIAVALALQPVLSNIFSGVAMVLDKTVRVGDWIVLENGTWGVIEKIGIRSTKIRSFDNELVVVPNTVLADNKIRNVSLPEPKVRTVVPFGVAYGSDIDKVKKIVLKEIKKIPHVIDDPKPVVRFLEMGDSSLNFKAFFYVDSFENRYGSLDEANTRIYNALNKAGIEIPFPQMDVHLKKQ